MEKFKAIFSTSIQQEFAYRVNFVMWRVRNIISIFLLFFLWDAVFQGTDREVAGYTRSQIFTYIFMVLLVRAIVFATKTTDLAGQIAGGGLNDFLAKPMSVFGYWFTRDMASKALNLSFAAFEVFILYLLLKPPIYLQQNPYLIFGFLVALALAVILYFYIVLLTSTVPFWTPEFAWGTHFLVTVIVVEFLSGAIFPLDIFPQVFLKILYLTPFPYLIFFPIEIYLGKISTLMIYQGLAIAGSWVLVLWFVVNKVWSRGIKVYGAYGR